MHTLEQLQSGELKHIQRLQIAQGLTEFPSDIYQLADSLEILDLSNNRLESLPDDLGRLTKLKVIFLSNNRFTELPEVLSQCPALEMVGFKSNQINTISETALPKALRWLILTDNKIEALPESIGQHTRLQKLMLAGNRLKTLPQSLQHCHNLQLVRLAANELSELPDWLLELPNLAWLAFAGNAFNGERAVCHSNMAGVALNQMTFQTQLGEGASGFIHRANWSDAVDDELSQHQEFAVKLFKGDITSDGYPLDELQACLAVDNHPNLVEVLAHINDEHQLGLVMKLIPESFDNLGLPPSLQSCTRDTFSQETALSISQIKYIAEQVADTIAHLHDNQFVHGDLYAHNILINPDAQILLGDLGASSPLSQLSADQQKRVQRLEVRAFGYLLDDLLSLNDEREEILSVQSLKQLRDSCLSDAGIDFNMVQQRLDGLQV